MRATVAGLILMTAVSVAATTSRRILLLSADPHASPGLLEYELAFRRAVAESTTLDERIDIDVEHLDSVHTTSPVVYDAIAKLLEAKYHDPLEPDLVVAVGMQPFRYLVANRQRLFPKATILVDNIQTADLPETRLHDVAALVNDYHFASTADVALRLLPDTRRAVVIIGSGPFEERYEPMFRRELAPLSKRIDVDWWIGEPMQELEKRIAHLPPQTIIIFIAIYRDNAGRTYVPWLAQEHLARYANAPMFAAPATWVGHGTVGDGRWSLERGGRYSALTALRLIRGETAADVGAVAVPPGTLVFDGAALKKWKISRSLLPAGSRIINDKPSLWQQHSTAVLIGLSVIVLQAILLAALALQRIARYRAESGARESRELYSAVADSLDERIATVSRDGTITAVNRAWTLFAKNHAPGALSVGSNYLDAVRKALESGQEDARMTLESLESVLSGREPSRTVGYFSPGTGERWRYEMHIVALRSAAGGAVLLIHDVTDRWRAEERVRVALESIGVATFLVGPDLTIELVNAQAEHLFGFERNEILGQSIGQLIPDADREAEEWFGLPETQGPPEEVQLTGRRKDRTSFPIAIHLRPIAMGMRRILLLSVVDLSERLRLAAEMQKLREETAHFGRVAAVGEMSAAIAHELNQPLTGIMTNCQAAMRFIDREAISPRDMHELFSDIIADARRAGDVIQRLRLMLRKTPVEVKPLDVNETVQQVVRVVGHDLALRGSALDLELTDDLPRILADRIHIQQVILNLILNGADAMSTASVDQRRMRLRTMPGINSTVELELRDNGPGIPPEVLPRVFEPFFTTKPNGMGMGLSIVRSIVETHGGTIRCANAASGGAVFTVTLPAATENKAA